MLLNISFFYINNIQNPIFENPISIPSGHHSTNSNSYIHLLLIHRAFRYIFASGGSAPDAFLRDSLLWQWILQSQEWSWNEVSSPATKISKWKGTNTKVNGSRGWCMSIVKNSASLESLACSKPLSTFNVCCHHLQSSYTLSCWCEKTRYWTSHFATRKRCSSASYYRRSVGRAS